MLYLVIMVVLAAAGITRLWLQQRREGARLDSVDGFREGLQALSAPDKDRTQVRRPATRPQTSRVTRGAQPLDPARREAAKRRIEARRRAARRRVA